MSGDRDPSLVWEVIDEWIASAEADREAALLCLGRDRPLLEIAAFHCQQAAEKLLKAFCVLADQKFRKTHDMQELSRLVGRQFPEMAALTAPVESWTLWNVVYRYPGEEFQQPPPSTGELQEAVAVVERLMAALQARRPGEDGGKR